MQRIRVMLAEDNAEIRQPIVRYLSEKEDIEIVATASNGNEVKTLVTLTKPDVLVLDIVMPYKDGLQVMSELRDEGFSQLRIIVLSGLSRDNTIRQAMSLGAYYYILKPFDPELLYRYIVQQDHDEWNPLGAMDEQPASDDAVLDMLLDEVIGASTNAAGGRYLQAAVRIAAGLSDLTGRITKEVYPAVAGLFDTNPAQVERAIRYAIEAAWERGSMKTCGLFHSKERPTNGEAIIILTGKYTAEIHKRRGEGRGAIPY